MTATSASPTAVTCSAAADTHGGTFDGLGTTLLPGTRNTDGFYAALAPLLGDRKVELPTCHGKDGDGRGPRAYFINPKPRNFLHAGSRAELNRPELYEHIGEGVRGTEMPAWDKVLTPQQIADVAEYVFRQFISSTK